MSMINTFRQKKLRYCEQTVTSCLRLCGKELISISLPLCSALLSGDFPSIKPNSSSKTPPPPRHPHPASPRFGFMSWMSSVSFAQPSAVSKKPQEHAASSPTSSLPPCPHRVEQKVVVISGPLRHNDRSCAAPTECNVLFWKEHEHREAATRLFPPG